MLDLKNFIDKINFILTIIINQQRFFFNLKKYFYLKILIFMFQQL